MRLGKAPATEVDFSPDYRVGEREVCWDSWAEHPFLRPRVGIGPWIPASQKTDFTAGWGKLSSSFWSAA